MAYMSIVAGYEILSRRYLEQEGAQLLSLTPPSRPHAYMTVDYMICKMCRLDTNQQALSLGRYYIIQILNL
jgi:hypothetical protein